MKTVRILFNSLLILSTSLLLILIGDYKFSGLQRLLFIKVSLQSMYVLLLITTILYLILFIKEKKLFSIILTAIPVFTFVIAFVLNFLDFIFPGILLLTFDVYIIIWFTGVLFLEIKKLKDT